MATLVAPRAGAWIETQLLKTSIDIWIVAPRAGAWIETSFFGAPDDHGRGRPPRGGVD